MTKQPTVKAQKRLEEHGWELISEYQGAMKPATCKHICGTESEVTQFKQFTNKAENQRVKCKTCEPFGEITRTYWTKETYNEEIKDRNIKLLGKWQGTKVNQLHQCLMCNYTWSPRPKKVLQNNGCPSCAGTIPWTLERYKTIVDSEEGYKLTESREPKNLYDKLEILHEVCGQSWSPNVNNFTKGSRCPNCIYSRGEKLVIDALDKYKVENATQHRFADCVYKNTLPFDSSVFRNGALIGLIEFDGIQHFEPRTFGGMSKEAAQAAFELQLERDKTKNDYCKDNQIPLLRISYLKTPAMVEAMVYSELAQHDLIDETEAWIEYYKNKGLDYYTELGLPEGATV